MMAYDLDQLIRLSSPKVKARAYLDAHRGQKVGELPDTDWAKEVLVRCPRGFVADTDWYTGCTTELWKVAKDIPPDPLYAWLWLLDQRCPIIATESELATGMGLVTATEPLRELERLGLIDRTKDGIKAVHRSPKVSTNLRLRHDRFGVATIQPGGITAFCRERGLDRGGILRVIHRGQPQYAGWRLF